MDKWLEVCVETTPERVEELADTLVARGVTGLVIEDGQDFEAFLAQYTQYWDYVDEELAAAMKNAARVKFYEPDDASGRAHLTQMTVGLADAEVTVRPIGEEDWANSWQKYYKPMAIGARLFIIPEWEGGAEIPPGRTPLMLNPGLTFGTGSHASTRLCLEALEQLVRPGDSVLDLGCGSGILSIAALNLGAARAVAVDIDPRAETVAYENAALNGIGRERYLVRAGDILKSPRLAEGLGCKRYELVLANIVADVIIPLSAKATDWLTEGGHFICSGIIDTRADEVAAALEANGLKIAARHDSDGWVAYVATIK